MSSQSNRVRMPVLAGLFGLVLLAGLAIVAQAVRPSPTASVGQAADPTAPHPGGTGLDATSSTAAGPSATPVPAPGGSTSAAPHATAGTRNRVPSGLRTVRAFITGYSYFDNTPPGSVDISNPVVHQSAGGTGTYADPITVAVGHSLAGGRDILDWPAGTRFYIPNLRRYFIVEDTCGDGSSPQSGPCHVGYPSGATTWLDVWIGGRGGTSAGAQTCMDNITGVWTVVVKPGPTETTVTDPVYGPSGCTKQYGDLGVPGV